MEQVAAKKGRGRPKKVVVADLTLDEENVTASVGDANNASSEARVVAGCGRVTRRNPGGRKPLADLQANTGEQARVRRVPAKATRRRPAAVKQVDEEQAGEESPQEDAPSKPSLQVVLDLEEPPRAKLKRGRARAAALAKKDAERAGETSSSAETTAVGEAPLRAVREVPGLPSDHKTRLELVRRVFETINAELEARCAALKASLEAQLPAVMEQLRLQQSKFTQEQLQMPLDKFVEQYCPNSMIVQRDDGSYNVVRRESMPVDAVTGCEGHLDGGLSEAFAQEGSIGASMNVAAGEQNIPSAVKWLTRGRVRDTTRELGEIMSSYIQASASHDFSLTSPSTVTPATWRRVNLFNAPVSAVKQPQGYGVTPRTQRRPQPGEILLSVNGSPLGQFG